ncbi:hypothetical protein BDQ12DRAFT_674018 [Crucibulum laeve]|uniref:Homeobox domain-containing protein n=1 Tax=Crucibulum laeve TaxID=68775 RepID=A0A5C3MI67_9AGAR|nr:hypothetical protein BDQ12DRAFT_674018 [Crucibulum laeve]
MASTSSAKNIMTYNSMQKSGPAGPSSTTRPVGRRLNILVLELFEEQRKRNPDPTLTERKALLEKVRQIPGYENYQIINLTSWFKRRLLSAPGRQQSENTVPPTPTADRNERHQTSNQNTLYPSLTPDKIQHLTILAQSTHFPSLDIITTWAILLKATPQDIVAWLEEHNRNLVNNQLLTPSDSTSPEPPSIFKQDPSSPAISTLITPAPSRTADLAKMPNPISISTQIVYGIADAVNHPQPTPFYPTTAQEFNAMFAPYEAKMKSLLHILQLGTSQNL